MHFEAIGNWKMMENGVLATLQDRTSGSGNSWPWIWTTRVFSMPGFAQAGLKPLHFSLQQERFQYSCLTSRRT